MWVACSCELVSLLIYVNRQTEAPSPGLNGRFLLICGTFYSRLTTKRYAYPSFLRYLTLIPRKKQWRWSSFGTYHVHNIAEKRTHPIVPPTNHSRTAYATWAPTGDAIAYVTDNDLYVLTSASYVLIVLSLSILLNPNY
jgi:hypothetical protein